MENIGCKQIGVLCGGVWDKMHEQSRRVYGIDGLAPTQHTCGGGNLETKIADNYRIRKLTPKEAFRLMGFSDEDYEKCKAVGMSDSQLYKQAGNSIVVNVLEEIFKQMF